MSTSKIRWSDFLAFEGARPLVIFILICLGFSGYFGALTPEMTKALSESYAEKEAFFESLWALIYLFIGIYLNRVIYQLAVNKFIKLLVQRTRVICYQSWLLNYEMSGDKKSRKEEFPQGEVLARIMSDTEAVRELITSGTFGIFIDLVFVVFGLVGLIQINLVSGGTLAVSEILAVAVLIWGSKHMRKIFLSVRNSRGLLARTIANVVGGVGETYYTDHQQYASKKGAIVYDDYLKKQLEANVWDASYYAVAESLYPLFLAILVFVAPYSAITTGAVIFAIIDLIQRSINPVKDIAGKIANIQRAATGFQRISEFLTYLAEGHSSVLHTEHESVQFKSLRVDLPYFSYPRRDSSETAFALNEIHFEAYPGELIGIVGLSGSGKSTLLSLMAGNLIPSQGGISIESTAGERISFPGASNEDVMHYRSLVGIVSQESHIFSETISFNLSLGEREDEVADFWQWASEKINYLKTWGVTVDTVLDQNTLSLGQKQLLSALRSCFLKKPIVLFDEISSGLDSELEKALRSVVLLIQEKSLTFIVAHRLETIIEAGKIIVLEDGRIIDSGIHSALLSRSQVYQEFIAELSH